MADILIQRGTSTVSADGETQAITTVGSLSSAFLFITNSRHTGGGTSTGNMEGDDLSVAGHLSDTSTITWDRPSTTPGLDQIVYWEVWEYVGAASGPNEFIVRSRDELVYTSATSATTSLTGAGISSYDDCVPFINGALTSDIGDGANGMAITAYITDAGVLTVECGVNDAEVKSTRIVTVEFVGSNWNVGHGRALAQTADSGTITLNTSTDGAGGSTFDVGDWATAFLASWGHKGDGTNDAIADHWPRLFPGAGTTTVGWDFHSDHDGSDDDHWVHVLQNDFVNVTRFTDAQNVAGVMTKDITLAGLSDLSASSVALTSTSSGTGTAYARGWKSAILTSLTNVDLQVGRSGNTCSTHIEVIDLTGLSVIGIASVSGDDVLEEDETDVVMTGFGFGAVQGTGLVEFATTAVYATATRATCTIDSWSDTSIQFDLNDTGIGIDTFRYIFITNDTGDRAIKQVYYGDLPYEIPAILGPDHYWKWNNSHVDEINGNNTNNVSAGTVVFEAKPLTLNSTHSLLLGSGGPTDSTEPADSSFMNIDIAATRRCMGGWVEIDSIQKAFVAFYEEGGGVNNMCLFCAPGNIVVVSVADSGDPFTVQGYSDFGLVPGRTYHVMWRWSGDGYDSRIDLLIDGVLQQAPNGGAVVGATLAAHSGDIAFGRPDGTLDVSGTDIQFQAIEQCNYAHWATWSEAGAQSNAMTDTVIREELFEKGSIADVTIVKDTLVNMQAALDVYADTLRPNAPICFDIAGVDGGGDFELVLDNITFDPAASVHVRFRGGGNTLTLVNSNGSNCSITSNVYGGTVAIVETAPITVTVTDINTGSPIENARVLLTAGATGPLTEGDEILKATTNASGVVTTEIRFTATQSITGRVRKASSGDLYQTSPIVASVTSADGISLDVAMIPDE